MEKYPLLKEAIANVLRERRESLGLSKRKLAGLAWLEHPYIIQLEQGTKQPTLNALFYISEALGLQPSELVRFFEDEIAKLAKSDGES
ncbi:MAG: helix-turn-helix domain-containing protein [Desulfovibrionaceae bacterium]|nr:helix-turn-helix domain-containing protein [Desulfovibrionaceae bacterium]